MPSAKSWILPKLANWQDFERLCVDLLEARLRPTNSAQRFGSGGQAQHGVDFVLQLSEGLHGFQCKLTETLTSRVVDTEVEKARSFPLPLRAFTLLTSADPDARIQIHVMDLNRARQVEGLFPIDVVFWPAIQSWLAEQAAVRRAHFPDIEPELHDLLGGAGRRLNREFPGSHLEIKTTGSNIDVVIVGGPEGIPFSATFKGEGIQERMDYAQRSGEPLTFTGEEFELQLPAAFDELFPREGTRSATLTMQPSETGATVDGRIVVHPRSRHPDLQHFQQRARTATDGIQVRLVIEQFGTERQVYRARPLGLPLEFLFEHSTLPGRERSGFSAERRYAADTPIPRVLEAEHLLARIDAGSYLAVVFDGRVRLASEVRSTGFADPRVVEAFRVIAHVDELYGWDVTFGDLIADTSKNEDLELARALCELHEKGRIVLGQGGRFQMTIRTLEQREGLRALLQSGQPPFCAAIRQEAVELNLFGHRAVVPPRVLRLPEILLSDEDMRWILGNGMPPHRVSILVPDTVAIVEEIDLEVAPGQSDPG